MPVAIIYNNGAAIPAVISNDTDDGLLAAMRAIKGAEHVHTVDAARDYLRGLSVPRGWFANAHDALAYTYQLRRVRQADGVEVKAAREALGLSRVLFSEKVGVGGNANTRHKFIFEVENGKKMLSISATLSMRALMVGFASSN